MKAFTVFSKVTFALVVALSFGANMGCTRNSISNAPAIEKKFVAADYETGITFDQIARTPDKYKGQNVKFSGKVIQVVEEGNETTLRVATSDWYNDVILVYYKASAAVPKVLDDDLVTLYGTFVGPHTYEAVLGNSVTIPLINAVKIVQGIPSETGAAKFDTSTNTFTGKDAVITIDATSIGSNYSGEPVLFLYFTITNKKSADEDVQSLYYEVIDDVYQNNGTTRNDLDRAFLWDGPEDHLQDKLLPGATISGVFPYKLEDQSLPIEIQFHDGRYGAVEHVFTVPLG